MCLYLHNASELFIPLWLIFMKRIDECMEFCCLFMRKILDSSFVRKYHCFVWNNKLVISLKKKFCCILGRERNDRSISSINTLNLFHAKKKQTPKLQRNKMAYFLLEKVHFPFLASSVM